jgi:hypothetical protein
MPSYYLGRPARPCSFPIVCSVSIFASASTSTSTHHPSSPSPYLHFSINQSFNHQTSPTLSSISFNLDGASLRQPLARAMCEPHTARQQRNLPAEATQQLDITASTPTTMTHTNTTMSSEKTASAQSPLSPPGSPLASSSSTQIQTQSIDVLASQLGNSSLSQYQHDPALSTTRLPESALSPISLPDDDCVNVSSILQHHPRSMEIDTDHDSDMVTLQNTSVSEDQVVPTTTINTHSVPFSPIAVDPDSLAEAPAAITTSLYRPNAFGGFEVDEGYCEDDDDFSWLPSVLSLRAASTPDGIKKRYDLGYRRSVDAASRCRNTIHSVPRMRRRDKKRSKHSQSAASSLRSRSDSQASSMVVSAQ